MTPDQIAQWAAAHEEARRSATQIEPPSFTNPDMDLEDAYTVQQAWVDLQIADGARLVGHKIGLTSKAMQASMQIDEPDFGALLDTMVYSDGAELPAAMCIYCGGYKEAGSVNILVPSVNVPGAKSPCTATRPLLSTI